MQLGEKYGADLEIVELGALLHDIALTGEDHHIRGAEISEQLLLKLNYPVDKIERVKNCVLNHRGSQDRKKENWGGCAFPGGKVELGESIIDSTIREIKEETGLEIKELKGCGYKDWIKEDIRRIVFLFKTNQYKGSLIENHREGRNFWISLDKIKELSLAERFLDNLPMFLEDKYTEMYLKKDSKDQWETIIK